MRILMVVEHYAPYVGGVETFFQELAQGLVREGHQVKIVTSLLPSTPAQEKMNGVEVVRIYTPPFARRYFFTFAAWWKVWLLASRFDVIHASTYNAALPAWLGARLAHRPIIITVHEVWGTLWYRLGMNRLRAGLYRLYEAFIFRLPYQCLVAVSEYTQQALAQMKPKGRTMVVYHGIDQSLFVPGHIDRERERRCLGLPTKKFLAMYFGRPGWAKGLETLVSAAQLMKDAPENVHFALILTPDPPERYQAVLRAIDQGGLRSSVTVVPPQPRQRLPAIIQSADCVVIPSLSEGFGFSAAEACAVGVPVVVSRAGSLPEVVSGQVAFFSPGNAVACCQAILRTKRGQVETIPAKKFSWDRAIKAYEQEYRHWCKGGEKE